MAKAKFNKDKCLKCRYHGLGCNGHTVRIGTRALPVFCNYSATENTCLKKTEDGQIVDIRGDDYENCKLFVSKKPEETDEEIYEFIQRRNY